MHKAVIHKQSDNAGICYTQKDCGLDIYNHQLVISDHVFELTSAHIRSNKNKFDAENALQREHVI
jgi:hypothetical protein